MEKPPKPMESADPVHDKSKPKSSVKDEPPTIYTLDLDALLNRVKDVADDLQDAGLNSSVGMGRKTEQVLNQLLTFLGALGSQAERQHADPEDAAPSEMPEFVEEIVVAPRTLDSVRQEFADFIRVARDGDLPPLEKQEMESLGNELAVLLTDIVESFENYKSVRGLNKLLWPLNAPFLRDRVKKYISKHRFAMNLEGGLRAFLAAVEQVPAEQTGERAEHTIKLRQKVAQLAWKELYDTIVLEAKAGKLSFSYGSKIIDTSRGEHAEIDGVLNGAGWSAGDLALYKQDYENLAKAFKRGLTKRVLSDFQTLWAMAEGNKELLGKYSIVKILMGTEEILTSLRNQEFIVILTNFLYPKKNKKNN